MPYLVEADFKTHVYAENLSEITRADATIVPSAIEEAIGMAKSYLSRFNLEKLFNPNAVGYVADATLKAKVKDMAVWYSLRLSNPNIQMQVAETNHDNAMAWIKDIQKGNADPDGWPYKTDDADTDYPEGSATSMYTGTPRRNHIPYSNQ